MKEIQDLLQEIKRSLREKKREIVPVKLKKKEAIKLLLQKHGKLTSSMLSQLIGLSRTRCNEYLKELEEEGIVTSEIRDRKKYYMLK